MPSDTRSISFVFHRDAPNNASNSRGNSRRRLQDRFDKEDRNSSEKNKSLENSWHNISLDSKRVLRTSADKITKTLSTVKISLDTFSQKFRSSTKRCHRLDEQYTPNHGSSTETPQTRSRCLLGRTPTKLYSPFGIESPKTAWGKETDITPKHAVPKLLRGSKSLRFLRLFKEKRFAGLR